MQIFARLQEWPEKGFRSKVTLHIVSFISTLWSFG